MQIRHAAQTFVLWLVVGLGISALAAAYCWGPVVFRHAAGLPGDTLPGARRKPTPAELEAARRTWMIRKFGSETNGPSVREVIEYHNANRIGPQSPDDVLSPVQ